MKILDVCCGSKMFYWQKNHKDITYMDIRREKKEIHGKKISVQPDIIGDFREIPFDDETFDVVVFDPPHLIWAGEKSIMRAQYGELDKERWPEDIKKGFEECFRVLKPEGVLVFKWSEAQIRVRQILEIAPCEPVLGNRRGAADWMVFLKKDLERNKAADE